MARIAVYLSAHGFGHAARMIPVLQELVARFPNLKIILNTSVPPVVFHGQLPPSVVIRNQLVDVGVVEDSVTRINLEETKKRWEIFQSNEEHLIASEVRFLRENSVSGIIFDVPSLAAEIASQAGVPSVGIGNFTWEFIFAAYSDRDPFFSELSEHLQQQLSQCSLFLRLPFHHALPMSMPVHDIPLIARHHQQDRIEVRRELCIDIDTIIVLIAMRGEVPTIANTPTSTRKILLLSMGSRANGAVQALRPAWEHRFSEIFCAADVIMSKPGYGIISECIANRKPLMHFPRADFPESPLLLEGMANALPNVQIQDEQLNAPHFGRLIEELAARRDFAAIGINGAKAAANSISDILALDR